MKYLLMLAAAASLAACHNRSEDEVGAAPDQGDSTAVVADTSTSVPTDSTMGQRPGDTDTSYVGQDTTTMQDTTEPTQGDSALTDHEVPDTTTGATPSDTSASAGLDTTSTTGQDTSSMGQPADSAAQPGQ